MPRAVRFKYPAKPLVAKVVLTSVRWTAELLCCALCVTRAQDTTAAKPARHRLQGRVYGNLTVYELGTEPHHDWRGGDPHGASGSQRPPSAPNLIDLMPAAAKSTWLHPRTDRLIAARPASASVTQQSIVR